MRLVCSTPIHGDDKGPEDDAGGRGTEVRPQETGRRRGELRSGPSTGAHPGCGPQVGYK